MVERNNQPLTTPEVWRYAYDPVGNLQRVDLANGIILDYVYDNLNRLEEFMHYAPDATPNDLSDNAKIAEFDYELRADGKREALNETFWENGVAKTNRTEWTYDAVGRLIDEVFDSWDDTLDYAAHYTLDLVGNRLAKTTDQGRDGTIDETITSTFDANDRLLAEVKDVAIGADTTTTYSYGGPANPATMQTKKEVRDTGTGALLEQSTFDYNLQNRLSTAITEQFDAAGNVTRRETSAFEYDTTGIRTKATRTIEVDDDANPSTPLIVESSTETSYLNDPHNLTGYSQILEETVRDLLTNTVARQLIYTIVHDVLAQTLFTPGGPINGETLLILPDGHGTTRMLADLAGQILTAAYRADGTTPVPFLLYDAYGNPLNFAPTLSRTSLLYTGEQFDPALAHYYLRARYYNPATGRFSRLDPADASLFKAETVHRYLYAAATPTHFLDPTGLDFSAAGALGSISIGNMLRAMPLGAVTGAISGAAYGGVDAALAGEDWQAAAARGLFWGGLLGGLFGLGSAGWNLLGHAAHLALKASFIGYNVAATSAGVLEAWFNGNEVQSGFRLFAGLIGAGFLQRVPTCFVAGTQILVPSDSHDNAHSTYDARAIETIRSGDLVVAADPTTGELYLERVVDTFQRIAYHLRALTLQSSDGTLQQLLTTNEHPFWAVDRGWVPAGDLEVGCHLLEATGNGATVIASLEVPHPEGTPVYNFQVSRLATYFVSDTPHHSFVLVHNANYLSLLKQIRAPGRFDATVGSIDEALNAVKAALGPDGIELAPALPGPGKYPPPPVGSRKVFQIHPAEPPIHPLPHVKYEDWTAGTKASGGSWGNIYFPESDYWRFVDACTTLLPRNRYREN